MHTYIHADTYATHIIHADIPTTYTHIHNMYMQTCIHTDTPTIYIPNHHMHTYIGTQTQTYIRIHAYT